MIVAKFYCPVSVVGRRPLYYCGRIKITVDKVVVRGCLCGYHDFANVDVSSLPPITFSSLSKFLDCCLAILGSSDVVFY